jgi:hypothetical protein
MSSDSVARFGKHKGKTESWVQRFDPRYLQWARANAPGMFGAPQEIRHQHVTQEKRVISSDELPEADLNDPSTPSGLYALAMRMIERGEI